MKKRSRLLLIVLAVAVALSAMSISVFAEKPKTVRITDSRGRKVTKITIIEGKDYQLDYEIRPDDADEDLDVTWSSSSSDIADVDDSGLVTAYQPGTATIRVRTANRKSATCEVYVPGKRLPGTYEEEHSNTSSIQDPGVSRVEGETIKLSGRVTTEIMLQGVRTAGGKTPTLRGYASVSGEALAAAAVETGGSVRFDTLYNDKVIGRLTIDTTLSSDIEDDIKIGVFCGTGNTSTVQKRFNQYFSNSTKVIRCEQSKFPVKVQIAAAVGDLSAKNLYFYSYNSSTGKYKRITVSDARKDSNNYLHFSTKTGGYIVVSDGPLKKK